MNENFEITPVTTLPQVEEVARLAVEIWHQHYITIITEAQIAYMLEKFQSAHAITDDIENDHFLYYLLELNDIAVGYLSIKVNENRLFLSKFYILYGFRGQKLARQTMDFLDGMVAEEGLENIWLNCNVNNSNALEVYKKLGFHIVDSLITDIGDGYVMDDYLLEKRMLLG